MANDSALILAWPETFCKQPGAWYDNLMKLTGFNQNGYYKVGHAAIVLINGSNGQCHYFDFGRYHAPAGKGRVRSQMTDHDLQLKTAIKYGFDGEVLNLNVLMDELQQKDACHGEGQLHAALIPIHFNKAMQKAKKMQSRIFIPYGPFVIQGTNCSRFVRTIAFHGAITLTTRLKLLFPRTLTPTPFGNVKSLGEIYPLKPTENIIRYENTLR